MKYCLIITTMLLTMNLQAQTATTESGSGLAVIKGHVKNYPYDFWEIGQDGFIGFTTLPVVINKNGDFSTRIHLMGDIQDLALRLNQDFIPLFVQKNDTIEINWDANDFKKTFTLKNTDSIRNRDLHTNLLLRKLYDNEYADLRGLMFSKDLTDSARFEKVNKLYNKEIETLLNENIAVGGTVSIGPQNEQIITGGTTVSTGTQKMAVDIYYKYSKLLVFPLLLPRYSLFLQHPSSKSAMIYLLNDGKHYQIESQQEFNSSWIYRYFLFDYARFYKSFYGYSNMDNNVAPFAPTWDEYYLGLANFHIYEIRDWFIANLIISGFADYSFDDVSAVYKDFMTKVKTPYYADTLKTFYANVQRLKPGNPAPAFTLKDENGKDVSLNDFKGKLVYLDFWGVHCGPCIGDIKNYVPALHEKYKDKNIVFINICVDEGRDKWKETMAKLNLNGVNLKGDIDGPVCKAYGINGIPHYCLIGTDGKIVDNNAPSPSFGGSLYAALDKLLNK